jgi:hypothetical protein
MKLALALAIVCTAAFAQQARVTFIRDFPGSRPPWIGITVERNGDAVYKESADDDYPVKFKLRKNEVDEIFDLAAKLDNFTRPIESGLKVANMGVKTFRFEQGPARHEVKFNFSLDENAKLLLDWFERMGESEQHYINLERTVKYDRLGVNQALLMLQISYDKKRIVAPDQYLPLLDRVVRNDGYMHMARERAAAIAESIRNEGKQAKSE